MEKITINYNEKNGLVEIDPDDFISVEKFVNSINIIFTAFLMMISRIEGEEKNKITKEFIEKIKNI